MFGLSHDGSNSDLRDYYPFLAAFLARWITNETHDFFCYTTICIEISFRRKLHEPNSNYGYVWLRALSGENAVQDSTHDSHVLDEDNEPESCTHDIHEQGIFVVHTSKVAVWQFKCLRFNVTKYVSPHHERMNPALRTGLANTGFSIPPTNEKCHTCSCCHSRVAPASGYVQISKANEEEFQHDSDKMCDDEKEKASQRFCK